MRKHFLLIILILVSAFLRFFRIYELTEFLGDQGRTGIVIYEAFLSKSLPLVGPPVLTGQHLGPFFYYLIGPAFISANFNPLGPSIFMALLGVITVLLIFYLGERIFGFWIGFIIATLYAVSPALITQSRTVWDPTPIPFFVVLFILALFKIFQERNFRWFLAIGVLLAILIQLHYPNLFFLFLTFIFWLFILIRKRKNEKLTNLLVWSFAGLIAFFITLLPFLVDQIQHDFVDIREIMLIFFSSGNNGTTAAPFYYRFLDLSSRLFSYIFSFPQPWPIILGGLIIFVFIVHKNFWHAFFAFWFISGILVISFPQGVIFDHYLNFLVPVPFFLFGSLLSFAWKRKVIRFLCILICLSLVILNLRKVDVFSKGNNDLLRTKLMTEEIISQAQTSSFSFTLISSRSFSDLHYRYFFLLNKVNPQKITDTGYRLLFLVCEKNPCPSEKDMNKTPAVQALCFDPQCSGKYPKINLKEFQLISGKEVLDGKIFSYKRRQTD